MLDNFPGEQNGSGNNQKGSCGRRVGLFSGKVQRFLYFGMPEGGIFFAHYTIRFMYLLFMKLIRNIKITRSELNYFTLM